MAQEAVERRTRRDRKLHHEIRALPIVSPAACLVKACCSATPMIAMAANTALAAKVAVGPTAVQSKPATTLAASNAAPVVKL
jgi:hypothetical protein